LSEPIRVIFVCTGNSARSQMAEAILRRDGGPAFDVVSAGVDPRGVNPLTIQALDKVGLDIRGARSKSVGEFLGQPFDYVITAQQARAYKPSLQIFKLAQQRTGAVPSRWLHVGQSLYHDVVPAQSLGIKTVWVNRASPRPGAGAAKTASARPDLELPDLKSLAQLTSENHELQTGS